MKKLGFGMMRLPILDADDPRSIDQQAVNRMADRFLANGFTYVDTAYPYHQGASEAAVRRAFTERYPRERFLLADKMPTFRVRGPEDYPRIFAEQLERCGVSYFDYYLLHAMGAKEYASTLRYDGFAFVRGLKAEGRARHIGLSYHDRAELLDEILTAHPEMEFVQLQINYVDWENETIQARACYEVATRHGKPVIAMEPVKGGSLARVPEEARAVLESVRPGMSPASWAIRYAASLSNVMVVLSGMSTEEQLADNVGYMKAFQPLTDVEQAAVARVAGIVGGGIAIPCTACAYCVDGCPKNIPIPRYFALYNDQRRFRMVPSHLTYFRNLIQEHGRPSDCVACGRCERHCPQHLHIIDALREVAATFESKI